MGHMVNARGGYWSYKSKLSFQYGLSVFLLTVVVLVCSPLMVATAKGSGKPDVVSEMQAGKWKRKALVSKQEGRTHTKDISLVQTIGGDDYEKASMLITNIRVS